MGPARLVRWLLIGAGSLVVVVAAIVFATRPLAPAMPVSNGFYPISSVSQGTAVGQAAPPFSGGTGGSGLIGLDGAPLRLDDFHGHPVWIVFWATWCTPCQEEVNDIRATYDRHRDDGLVVLAVDVQEPAASVRDYVSTHGIDYTVGLDSTGQVKQRYGAWGLPTHYFLDRAGIVRDAYFGQLSAELMEERLRTILAG